MDEDAVRYERCSVCGHPHRHAGSALRQFNEHLILPRIEMLDEDENHAGVDWKVSQEFGDGFQASSRGSDSCCWTTIPARRWTRKRGDGELRVRHARLSRDRHPRTGSPRRTATTACNNAQYGGAQRDSNNDILAASRERLVQTRERILSARTLGSETYSLSGDWRPEERTVPRTPPAPAESPQPSELKGLTKREVDVLRLIAEGRTTKELAFELNITFKTAACHRFNLMRKLEVREVASMVRIAIRAGLVRP